MAEIVLGVATSHTPQLSVPWQEWRLLREKDETDPRLDFAGLTARTREKRPDIQGELTPECFRARYEACQAAIATLGERLRQAQPDVLVVLGDDQHEQFLDDNLPALAIYHGSDLNIVRHPDPGGPGWKHAEEKGWAPTDDSYPGAPDLATHLVRSLSDAEFDVARTNGLRTEVGVGHAFSFVFRRLLPGARVPLIPVMVNTYYPPNQPTPGRCYDFGRALVRSIQQWDGPARVAIIASGGLSHVIIDEEVDEIALRGLRAQERATLAALPRERLVGGTSEILNWVALGGAMEGRPMTLVHYAPVYRTVAGTGCGMAFAYWN